MQHELYCKFNPGTTACKVVSLIKNIKIKPAELIQFTSNLNLKSHFAFLQILNSLELSL